MRAESEIFHKIIRTKKDGALSTDFPKSLEDNFRQTFYQSGMLPNRVTEEWKQIAAYCNVTDEKEKKKRMENFYH